MADDTMGMEPGDRQVLSEAADHIAELKARMILAMRLDYANYPGYVTTALHGKDIPEEVLRWADKICTAEEYDPALEVDGE